MMVKKFHQFVKVERGPVNSAVIDLLKGHVYQVENSVIVALEQGKYKGITGFVESAKEADLIIEIENKSWLPSCGGDEETREDNFLERELHIELHVEEGIDLEAVLGKLKYHNIYKVIFYGQKIPKIQAQRGKKIVRKKKDFSRCIKKSCINGEFEPVTEPIYKFNKKFNSCWGEKLAVTKDGKVRPCVYSSIVVGDIFKDDIEEILERIEKYWKITKDEIEKCKDCELRYVCFDCREMAKREGGNLFSAPPTCHYDPYKGNWEK